MLDQRFLVTILEVKDERIRVSFPGRGFPLYGMLVHLEFHGEGGFSSYQAEVMQSPREAGDGLLLKRPESCQTTSHRLDLRVPAEIEVQFKAHAHPRRNSGKVLNLSAGGVLLECRTPLSVGDSLDLELSLPGARHITTVGQVAFVYATEGDADKGYRYGVRFLGLDPEEQRAITGFVWHYLRSAYPWRFPGVSR